MCSMTVPSHHAGPCSASAAPLITPVISSSDCARRVVECRPTPRRAGCATSGRARAHAVVMTWQHTVFAVIAAQLSQERHRLLGALLDQLAEHQSWRGRTVALASISGGKRSRTETSKSNQWV